MLDHAEVVSGRDVNAVSDPHPGTGVLGAGGVNGRRLQGSESATELLARPPGSPPEHLP